MFNEYHINENSFGSILPYNWQEIADYLNDKIDEIDDYSEEAVSAVWNAYQSGEYEDAPKAVSCQSTSYELLEALDNAGSWDEDFVEETARELCERAGVNFDTYEDYDTLFDALKRAILG